MDFQRLANERTRDGRMVRRRRRDAGATRVVVVVVSLVSLVTMVTLAVGVAASGTPSAGTGRWDGTSSAEEAGGAAAFARRVRALPVGPCPLAPLAICEKLNYVVVEEERAAKEAAEACARLPTGRRLLCAATRRAAATLSRAVNWGETTFAREVRIVPLPGKRGGSRAASFDHALTALCDLRMNKLCGDVVDQRFEHAAKQAELKHECDIAESLSEQWETAKEMCEAKAVEIKLEKEAMDRELLELEDDYAKKFGGGAKPDLKTLKKMSKGKTPPSLNCRSKEYGDKPENDDVIIIVLRQTREKLVQTRANGGYCNKEAVDSIVNSKTSTKRDKALKKVSLPGEYFEHCDGVLKHLDFMINLLDLQRKAKHESQGQQYRPWCEELDLNVNKNTADKDVDADYVRKRNEMLKHAAEISRKRAKFERQQLALIEKLRSQCTTQLNEAQRLHLQSLIKCEAHGPRLRLLREDIIVTEAKVERIVPALDQTISAVAILGATPESAAQLASAVNVAELARITPDKSLDDIKRMLGDQPFAKLRQVCSESAMLGSGGGKRGESKTCPEYLEPGPIACAKSCAAMDDASIGRVARRDKPFALGIIAGIAIGYILFAKLRAHELNLDLDEKRKSE